MNGPSPMFTAWIVLLANIVLTGLGLLAAKRKWTLLASIVAAIHPDAALSLASSSMEKPTYFTTSAALTAGGGTSRTRVSLPVWNQLNDPLPDGQQDAFATSDCGEECVAEVIYGLRGVVLSAGAIRYMLGGTGRPGYSTASDLVSVLRTNNIPAAAITCGWPDAVAALERQSAAREPAIVLGTWLGGPALHWVALSTMADGVMHFNDPWGGSRRKLSYADASICYQGSLVAVAEAVRYPSA